MKIRYCTALGAVVLCLASAAFGTPLTPAEQNGKQIYHQGSSNSGVPITAWLEQSSVSIPATALPCANCHGEDGLGRPEGGVLPPALTWNYLNKSYGHEHPGGRKHPAFTDQTLGVSIRQGVDPAGNPLHGTMPRYELSPEDLADLIAYLKRLDSDADPGLEQHRIRIGTLLPLDGPYADLGHTMQQALQACLSPINANGGIYGRELELVVINTQSQSEALLASAEQLLQEGDIFALLSPFAAGIDKELATLAEYTDTPLIGPYAPLFEGQFGLPRHTFYLYSGLQEQAQALIRYYQRETGPDAVAVLYADDDFNKPELGKAPEVKLFTYRDDATLQAQIDELATQGFKALLSYAPVEHLASVLKAAQNSAWQPRILLPGSLASADLLQLPNLPSVLLAYPYQNLTPRMGAYQEFTALMRRHQLPPRHLAAQLAVFQAVKILTQGLKLSGRDLSQQKLVAALETLYQYDSGYSAPLSFGPNRRIGALGAYIMALDEKNQRLTSVSDWISLD